MTPFPLYQTTCFFIPLVAPCTPMLVKDVLEISSCCSINRLRSLKNITCPFFADMVCLSYI